MENPYETHPGIIDDPQVPVERFVPSSVDPLLQAELLRGLLGEQSAEVEFVLGGLIKSIQRERIDRGLEIARLKEENAELQETATHDVLTGLENRLAYNNEIERWAAANQTSAERNRAYDYTDSQRTLIVVDLDNFKAINDDNSIGGYKMGDRCLQIVSRAFELSIRAGDHVYRLGGDEIVVMADEAVIGEDDDQAEASPAFAAIKARYEELMQSLITDEPNEDLLEAIGGLSDNDRSALMGDPSKDRLPLDASFGAARFMVGMTAPECVTAANKAMNDMKERKEAKKAELGIESRR